VDYPDTLTGTDCDTTNQFSANARDDGPMKSVSVNGTTRYYCSTPVATNKPLVLFFPGSGSKANGKKKRGEEEEKERGRRRIFFFFFFLPLLTMFSLVPHRK
jgi:hypothetical protein